jgi:hypothetical protein
MTAALSAETFAPHVGEEMSLANGHRLALIAVNGYNSHPPDAPGAAFSLLLRGAPAPLVPEGMHHLTLENGGSFDLYLIPNDRVAPAFAGGLPHPQGSRYLPVIR